jgi:hypothetical protein
MGIGHRRHPGLVGDQIRLCVMLRLRDSWKQEEPEHDYREIRRRPEPGTGLKHGDLLLMLRTIGASVTERCEHHVSVERKSSTNTFSNKQVRFWPRCLRRA